MNSTVPANGRVLSGMRPTGQLHLGHYHGVLKNWLRLQHEYDCFFFVADWHALTTHYEDSRDIVAHTWDMVIDWLAAGVNPGAAKLFIQSRVPEHAELHLLLSMITPLGWLERVPTYKDQQEKLKERDLATYGFLGYPLLQSADILIYRATGVPVGEDQVAHVELTREVARRFNHLYGREPDFEQKAEQAIRKMGKKNSRLYNELRRKYQEQGDHEALAVARALLEEQQNLSLGDRERLFGYLEGSGRIILPEPQALLTPASRMPGLDGQKMSKSYGNTISLREAPESVEQKLRTMPTDPARTSARSGSCTRSIPTRHAGNGCARAAPRRASVAWTASSPSSRPCRRSWRPSATGPRSMSTTPAWCAPSSRKAARRRAMSRVRLCRRFGR